MKNLPDPQQMDGSETCIECESDDLSVDIQLVKEGDSVHSREPYRILECRVCGQEMSKRMNKR